MGTDVFQTKLTRNNTDVGMAGTRHTEGADNRRLIFVKKSITRPRVERPQARIETGPWLARDLPLVVPDDTTKFYLKRTDGHLAIEIDEPPPIARGFLLTLTRNRRPIVAFDSTRPGPIGVYRGPQQLATGLLSRGLPGGAVFDVEAILTALQTPAPVFRQLYPPASAPPPVVPPAIRDRIADIRRTWFATSPHRDVFPPKVLADAAAFLAATPDASNTMLVNAIRDSQEAYKLGRRGGRKTVRRRRSSLPKRTGPSSGHSRRYSRRRRASRS